LRLIYKDGGISEIIKARYLCKNITDNDERRHQLKAIEKEYFKNVDTLFKKFVKEVQEVITDMKNGAVSFPVGFKSTVFFDHL
jgi:hypothetical protein